MSVLFDWRINEIERVAHAAKDRLHELGTLRSDVGSLEHSLREIRAEVDGLRAELQASKDSITQLERRLEEMEAQ